MKTLPKTDNALVVRTDFGNDKEWENICEEIMNPENEFEAFVEFVENKDFEELSTDQLPSYDFGNSDHSFIFLVDKITFLNPEHPILCVDLLDEFGKSFRITPASLWIASSCLSAGNKSFWEFTDSLDSQGIYRPYED